MALPSAIRVVFHYPIGNLFHYGHFIVDAVLPFLTLLRRLLPDGTETVPHGVMDMILIERRNQHLSQFTEFWSHFFPIIRRVIYYPEDAFYQNSASLYEIHGYQFGPYPRDDLVFAERVLGWSQSFKIISSMPTVLVIERGHVPLRLPPCIRANAGDTGARRRCLQNQQEINQVIRNVCGTLGCPVKFIELERLGIQEQHRLFAQADIVVAQHGAGLCNLIFGRRHNLSVLEISHWGLKTIAHLATAKDMQHQYVNSTMKWCCPQDLRHKLESMLREKITSGVTA